MARVTAPAETTKSRSRQRPISGGRRPRITEVGHEGDPARTDAGRIRSGLDRVFAAPRFALSGIDPRPARSWVQDPKRILHDLLHVQELGRIVRPRGVRSSTPS